MKRNTTVISVTLGAAAFALLIGATAYAQGPGGKHGGHERPSFSDLDADGDGNLTIAEMQARAADRFAQMDINGDGVLSAEEMAAAAAEDAGERASMMFARLLEWRDSDGDGALSQAEMGDNRAERMFSHVDADADGVITADEYEQAQAAGPRMGRGRHGGNSDHGKRQGG